MRYQRGRERESVCERERESVCERERARERVSVRVTNDAELGDIEEQGELFGVTAQGINGRSDPL